MAAERPVILELRDLRFSYAGGIDVLDGVSLSIPTGGIVGIVGPSGCGKSTLLSLVAGLSTPTSGTIARQRVDPKRHPLSMVFQKDTVLPWLSVADNVRLFARFKRHGGRSAMDRLRRRSGDQELDDRVAELLTIGGLSDRADAYPYQLSGGMRRRLAFLTAVAADPEVLLLDEPFSSVDEPTRVGIHQDVFRIARMMNMSAMLVTHDLAEAITLCDRVVILSNRPARVATSYEIPFGEERQMLELRETKQYLELYGHLWHDLSQQIAAGRTASGAGSAAR
jgi:NitT/TauT family transport system ATP-binding protein